MTNTNKDSKRLEDVEKLLIITYSSLSVLVDKLHGASEIPEQDFLEVLRAGKEIFNKLIKAKEKEQSKIL